MAKHSDSKRLLSMEEAFSPVRRAVELRIVDDVRHRLACAADGRARTTVSAQNLFSLRTHIKMLAANQLTNPR